MKITDCINSSEKTIFSIEVLPPVKGMGLTKLFDSIDRINEFGPKYINITTHHSEYVYTDAGNGMFKRTAVRRRPGTVAVAAAIQHKYGLTVVPHLVCSGSTSADLEYALLDLQFLGITDLLLLRGDKAKHEPAFTAVAGGYEHTTELIGQVNRYNEGFFVDGSPIKAPGRPFSYGVACYPEKHEEAPNLENDLEWLKRKVEMGAEYAVTQLFYDNEKYFHFVEMARQAGITVPIIPGIKPFAKMSQLTVVPKTFKVDLPQALAIEAAKCKNDAEAQALGVEWCVAQCKELMAHGVPSLHFYTVSAVESIRQVAKRIY